jgi:hypothetical protein
VFVAINLDPPEALTAFQHQLLKGKFIRVPADAGDQQLTGQVLEFQYNPETITRTRTGQWEARNRRRRSRAPSSQEVRSRSAQGSSALLADSETISMKIVFDATEAILAGQPAGAEQSAAGGSAGAGTEAEREGVLQYLAALELIPMGKAADPRQGRRGRDAARPVRPDQLLLVLGTERFFPVVITSLTITEQKFGPNLVPIRAEVDLKMNVLEATETAYNEWIRRAFNHLVSQRQAKAREAYSQGDDALSAISRALNPPQQ